MKSEKELRDKLTELREQYEKLDKSECTEENRLIRYDLLKAKYEAMHVLRSEMAILEWALDEPRHWRTSWEMERIR
ncbi:hypothetical protein ANME2D_02338 [Candidatus Methanoperedens nitroreducens]|uniref:Uncharacterized protein n=1 Tax=Candidatus Methanoperedens nitratireducens TaxID=1392998 RepID=A0A062V4S2_9EURY|nr:hypothetical protein [Candidatus Methanoperedens nitroreducens]KCZ71603.1 hypothetical protein ANME2D_02338 [Candidatus Methanoperedens nitroreducens]MDJ1421235.1 hypothetical protein [Candidatus Methanoperedens sp.]